MTDAEVYFRPWGLDYASIRHPIHYWHGGRDRNIPLSMARWLFDRLPEAEVHVSAEEGHYSIANRKAEEVLEFLAEK